MHDIANDSKDRKDRTGMEDQLDHDGFEALSQV